MKRIILSGLVCSLFLNWTVPFAQGDYLIDLKTEMNGEDIQASTLSSGQTTLLVLESQSPKKLYCETVFHSGPEFPRVKKRLIEPMEKAVLTYTSKREIIRMKVNVNCHPNEDR